MAYVYEDDILAPKGTIVIEYWGPNPFAIYPKIPGFMMTFFEARSVHYHEDEFRWDVTADPRPFFIQVHLDKGLDKWTRGIVKLKIWGAQPSDPTKNGRLLVELKGSIKTSYPVGIGLVKIPRFLLLPFIWFYHHAIYNRVRRRYIQMYKENIEKLESGIRSTLDVMMRRALA